MTTQSATDRMMDLPIFHKTYSFIIVFSNHLDTFPKKDRFAIGARIENTALELLTLVMRANYEQAGGRVHILSESSITLDVLKVLVRLAKDKEALSPNQYLLLEEQLQEIGRMLGGWIKSSYTKRPR